MFRVLKVLQYGHQDLCRPYVAFFIFFVFVCSCMYPDYDSYISMPPHTCQRKHICFAHSVCLLTHQRNILMVAVIHVSIMDHPIKWRFLEATICNKWDLSGHTWMRTPLIIWYYLLILCWDACTYHHLPPSLGDRCVASGSRQSSFWAGIRAAVSQRR